MNMRSSKMLLPLVIILSILGLLLCIVSPFIGIVTLLYCIGNFIWIIRFRYKYKHLPILTLSAKVVSKLNPVAGTQYGFTTRCFATFELANGTRKMFRVPFQVYGTILENENGILSYKEQGKILEFIGFQKTI